MEMRNKNVLITDDPKKMDFEVIHNFLTHSYWSEAISVVRMKRAMENSLNVGLFVDNKLLGYSRIITDKATFAYLCDVFVLDEARGKGYSKMMMEFILKLPELQNIKRFVLATKDAHGLYAQFGWKPLVTPEMYMEINKSGIYKTLKE